MRSSALSLRRLVLVAVVGKCRLVARNICLLGNNATGAVFELCDVCGGIGDLRGQTGGSVPGLAGLSRNAGRRPTKADASRGREDNDAVRGCFDRRYGASTRQNRGPRAQRHGIGTETGPSYWKMVSAEGIESTK